MARQLFWLRKRGDRVIEQEMASVIKFVLDRAGGPAPYYWSLPQHFTIPAAYFPTPEIDTGGETFLTYNIDYVWYIKLFDKTGQSAYALGSTVVMALRAARNLVPLIEQDGSEIKGSWVRVNDPQLKVLDDGAAQLTVSWRSRRPYSDVVEGAEKSKTIHIDTIMRPGQMISDAYAQALESYAIPLQ